MIQNFFNWRGYFNKQLNEFKTRKNNFNSQLISMISAKHSPTPHPTQKKKTNQPTNKTVNTLL